MIYNLKSIQAVKAYLLARHLSLAVAESVTSGHIQAAFSAVDNATGFYQGGITVYNVGQKTRHLNVDPVHALECNCVSAKVALEMALNVNRLFLSDVGMSITGYAAPVPELGIDTLFAYVAVAKKDHILCCEKIISTKTNAVDAQIDYANQALELLGASLPEEQ